MLALYAFLAAFLWGSFVGAKIHRGYPFTKIHIPRGDAIFGTILFTLPVVSMLLFAPASGGLLITAGVLTVVGFGIGIRVGITTYWID